MIFSDDTNEREMISNLCLDEPSFKVVVFIDDEIKRLLKLGNSNDLFVDDSP